MVDGRTYSILGVARQGFSGEEPGKFIRPTAIALDSQQNVYVSDETGRVQKFDGSSGRLLDGWNKTGVTGLIAVDDQGNIFIRDDNARTIVKFRQP